MRRVSRAIALVIVVVVAGGLSAAASGPNLVTNADFTQGVQGNGVPIGWGVSVPAHFTRSDSIFRTSPTSGRIEGGSQDRVNARQRLREISGGTAYHVSAWIFIDTVDPLFQVLFQVRWFDDANQPIQTDTIANLTVPNDGFSRHVSVLNAPALATAATVRFVTIGLAGGVFVDTVVFRTVQ